VTLSVGTRLGPYEILSPLGAGGMGEVYRARDTRLDRAVAVKVLPALFAQDPDRHARFEREAKLLAALNHPGIAHVYGFETAALPDGGPVHLLAMELVPGEDLAARLARGPIPVDEAIEIARQIAEALEEAHEKGIVHRDLKPANVKVTPDGKVKVLDFGLAKAWAGDAGSATSSVDLSQSPTLAHTGTQAGLILGTAAYMSPEQARGKPVDKRADIWAFGVLIFEMLTGRRLFQGETVSDTLAAVLRQEIPWPTLPAETPAAVQRLLRRCLERDAKQRLRDIGEGRVALNEALSHAETGTAAGGVRAAADPSPAWSRGLPWTLTALALAAAALVLWAPWRRPAALAPPLRLSVALGADVSLDVREGTGPAAILSPDGSLLAFVGKKEGDRPQLFLRRLDQLKAAPLADTEGAQSPFFSPEGQWIAFFADAKLKRVSVTGGATVVLADAPFDRGGSWSDDGTIFFSASGVGLSRVSWSGGATEVLTTPDAAAGESTHRWPQALPGGKAVLFTAMNRNAVATYDEASIVAQRLPNGPRKVVVPGGYHGRYLPSGHVVFLHGGTLFTVPFDRERLEATGPSVPVIEECVSAPYTAGAQFAFSDRGTLAYLPGHSLPGMMSIQWLDRAGNLSPLRAVPGNYRDARFSPDGTKLAFQLLNASNWDVWVYEWTRDRMSRLTSGISASAAPVWSPDGRGVVFTRRATLGTAQPGNLHWQRADGTGEVQRLTESRNWQQPSSWHPSGKYIAYTEISPQNGPDVMILPIEGDAGTGFRPGPPTALLDSHFNEGWGAFSPDGRWLAYTSNETGQFEVYARSFPQPGGKWQISTEGGRQPAWSRNGRELFYVAPDQRLMVASYAGQGGSFHVDKPRRWSETRLPDLKPTWSYDPHPDGQRIAVLQPVAEPGDAKRDTVVLFLNFFDELRRLAPPGGARSAGSGGGDVAK